MSRLVDVDKLKNEVENIFWYEDEDMCKVLDLLAQAPTIDPVKHGKWLDGYDDDGVHFKYCSECGSKMPYIISSAYSEDEWVEAADCCWHCSAKMDGEVNE